MRISDWSSDVCSSDLKNLTIGSAYVIYGSPSLFNNQISISHPEMEPYVGSNQGLKFQPVYASTEKLKKLSLDSKGIQRLVSSLFSSLKDNIDETLPDEILTKYKLIDLPSALRSEEHTSELQSLMRISYAVFCLKKKNYINK